MKLENIGFYTLSDVRAKNASDKSPLQRCELILTDRCNFHCPYCRGLDRQYQGDMSLLWALQIVDRWAMDGLKNIRFSGGEPTAWPGLAILVRHAKSLGIERIALSTNGSASKRIYEGLLDAGVNDFSISLDACCSSTADAMAGTTNQYNLVLENIAYLAQRTYVTLGVVLTEKNMPELMEIISVGETLGVADIRIIPAAQYQNILLKQQSGRIIQNKPILGYRLSNMREGVTVRGLTRKDNRRCPLVLDDMAIAGDFHFPCIIYLRERGKPIGNVTGKTMEQIRAERKTWAEKHDCYLDPICRGNCLDVCRDYNNRWLHLHLEQVKLPWMNPENFNWLTWHGASLRDLGIASRWIDITSEENIRTLKEHAVGWCLAEEIPCRPKENQVAVMFQQGENCFWLHMWKNEFYEVFKQAVNG